MNASPAPDRRHRRLGYLAIVLLLLVAAEVTAAAMTFLCDDAYIAFRYVHNAHAGHGLVWNQGMAPVEGYTSFAWVMLLWAAWSWFGVAPPEAAIPLSMICHAVEFVVVAIAATSLVPQQPGRWRHALPIAALVTLVGSRTFLQWMSGGRETALFNCAFVSWVLLGFHRAAGTTRWFVAWSALAALAALTRPDGLLLALITGAGAVLHFRDGLRAMCTRLSPLVVVLVHLAWRRNYYGEWLPNTYYAKVGEPWPDAGLRYLACFALESGVWLVPLIALPWALQRLVRGRPRGVGCAALVVVAVLLHLGFYVVAIGGDHFEYRVLSHLPPLAVLAVAAMTRDATRRAWPPLAALAALLAASSFGWLHAALTTPLPLSGLRPIADDVPAPLRPIARWFDRQQAWLIYHRIGLRCSQHGALLERFRSSFPQRMAIVGDPGGLPARIADAVGYSGWVMPEVAVLDSYGLNDWVVARWREPAAQRHGSPEVFREFLRTMDTNRDGWLDRNELGLAIENGITGRSDRPMHSPAFLTQVLLLTHARRRDDALDLDEALAGMKMMLEARLMAHERHPPEGYFEAFEPNVEIVEGHLVARPRRTPLDLETARRIEARWRARVTAR